tara:strand:+ start:119 stop:373 length:255 start_codon:yes stop_codon:yes gene_type:complete
MPTKPQAKLISFITEHGPLTSEHIWSRDWMAADGTPIKINMNLLSGICESGLVITDTSPTGGYGWTKLEVARDATEFDNDGICK